jgi:signal transduction histidine kinase
MLEKDIKDKAAILEVERPLGWVLGHPATINQILANLAGNALKFIPSDRAPRIRIGSTRNEGLLRFSVQDNGIGIDPEHHRKIFGLFERLHSTQDYPGTGIGLALVRKGAERMGGRVGLLSELGQGSVFWVDLPAAENPNP